MAVLPLLETTPLQLLRQRAASIRESLHTNQTNSDNMVSVLGSFDHRLSSLDSAMRPLQAMTDSVRIAHENIDKCYKVAGIINTQFELSRVAEQTIVKGPHEDLGGYVETIDQMRNVVKIFIKYKTFRNSDVAIEHANSLLAKSVTKLEEEFQQVLSSYSEPLDTDRVLACISASQPPSSDVIADSNSVNNSDSEPQSRKEQRAIYKPPAFLPPWILPVLQILAHQMFQAWHHQQLLKIYKDTRSVALEVTLQKLGVEKLRKDEVERIPWEDLEPKIGHWINFMQISVRLLFIAEREICDQVFGSIDSLRDQCFAEVSESSFKLLLNFGNVIARTKRSPEKLIGLLDMYRTMRELHLEIQTIFCGAPCAELRKAAAGFTRRLAETAVETFACFEEAVEKDAGKIIKFDGSVLLLTSWVMNYLKLLPDYRTTLVQLFNEFEGGDQPKPDLESVILRILQALLTNLDMKSKQYKDPDLSNIFLMNNIYYIIVKSGGRSGDRILLGNDWIHRQRKVVQLHAKQYQRSAWAKIVKVLSAQGLTSSSIGGGGNSSGASKALIKDRFNKFNTMFEELHQKHSQWVVSDPDLRESVILSVAEILLQAYRFFTKEFGSIIQHDKNHQRYIRYSPEDLERMLNEFFCGAH